MRLLHLSDIHFREPDCLSPQTDPDAPFRTRLVQDVIQQCNADGLGVDAILVGGDIAYKADEQEYQVAEAWLLDLAENCGCPPERIYVVPGNHDVDRGICGKSRSVANAQEMIAQAGRHVRERTLRDQLRDVETGRALFLPLEAYNKFAAKFACNIFPEQPFWRHDLELGNGVTLAMYGLTSTLLSGLGNRDVEPGKLYLSPLQTVLNPDPNKINLVLCHHPPSWFLDKDQVNDDVNNRAALQLFGHKHKQRCTREQEYIRFSAGAVNPDRYEPDWCPGYNIIDLKVDGAGAGRGLQIRTNVRHLQRVPEMFTALQTAGGEAVWNHRIPCREFVPLVFGRPVDVAPVRNALDTDGSSQDIAVLAAPAPPDVLGRTPTARFITPIDVEGRQARFNNE
jgi:predicted MPP superfamily phosphohydrolase